MKRDYRDFIYGLVATLVSFSGVFSSLTSPSLASCPDLFHDCSAPEPKMTKTRNSNKKRAIVTPKMIRQAPMFCCEIDRKIHKLDILE